MAWPPLADLPFDIAGNVPDSIVEGWQDPSARSSALAAELLAPFERTGTVVCSDTAGLSRMASVEPLAVVLKRIAEPKERIHALGTAIGGLAVGTWVADNTEMFYPAEVPLDAIVDAMLAVHRPDGAQVGIGVHRGTVYAIAGGLYGPDADRIEHIAENHIPGGETWTTAEVYGALTSTFDITPRPVDGEAYVALRTDRPLAPSTGTSAFPIPYDAAMNALLAALDESDVKPVIAAIEASYLHDKVVVLAQRHTVRPVRTLVQTVDGLFGDHRFQNAVRPLLAASGALFTVGGSLALAAVDTPAEAIALARRIQSATRSLGLVVNVGVERGRTYLFPMPDGSTQFAGDPVNRASKMAEDLCEPGELVVSAATAAGVELGSSTTVQWTASGIVIDAVRLT